MAVTWSKVLALFIAIGYVTAALLTGPSAGPGIMVGLIMMPPVAMIWIPEHLGGSWTKRKKTVLYTYDEPAALQRPLRDSHPGVVCFMGWFFLVGLPPLVYVLTTRTG
ncbi:MAG: hypothetical protein L0Y71_13615 [Gemmataceae bacterium]|nr:hypothetical protein [Gemmataceae bacterium]